LVAACLLAPEEGPIVAVIGATAAWSVYLIPWLARLAWSTLILVGSIVWLIALELALALILVVRSTFQRRF